MTVRNAAVWDVECVRGVNGQPQVGLFDVVITAVHLEDSQQRSETTLTVTPGGQPPEGTRFIQLIGRAAAEATTRSLGAAGSAS